MIFLAMYTFMDDLVSIFLFYQFAWLIFIVIIRISKVRIVVCFRFSVLFVFPVCVNLFNYLWIFNIIMYVFNNLFCLPLDKFEPMYCNVDILIYRIICVPAVNQHKCSLKYAVPIFSGLSNLCVRIILFS